MTTVSAFLSHSCSITLTCFAPTLLSQTSERTWPRHKLNCTTNLLLYLRAAFNVSLQGAHLKLHFRNFDFYFMYTLGLILSNKTLKKYITQKKTLTKTYGSPFPALNKKIVIATFFFLTIQKKKFSVVWYKLPIASHKVKFCGGGRYYVLSIATLYVIYPPVLQTRLKSPTKLSLSCFNKANCTDWSWNMSVPLFCLKMHTSNVFFVSNLCL